MANMASFNVDGASYTYDMESKNPIGLENTKKAVTETLVYDTEGNVVEDEDED